MGVTPPSSPFPPPPPKNFSLPHSITGDTITTHIPSPPPQTCRNAVAPFDIPPPFPTINSNPPSFDTPFPIRRREKETHPHETPQTHTPSPHIRPHNNPPTHPPANPRLRRRRRNHPRPHSRHPTPAPAPATPALTPPPTPAPHRPTPPLSPPPAPTQPPRPNRRPHHPASHPPSPASPTDPQAAPTAAPATEPAQIARTPRLPQTQSLHRPAGPPGHNGPPNLPLLLRPHQNHVRRNGIHRPPLRRLHQRPRSPGMVHVRRRHQLGLHPQTGASPSTPTENGGGAELTVVDVIHSIRTSAGETSYNPGRWNIYGVDDSNFDVKDHYNFTYNMNQPEPLLLGQHLRRRPRRHAQQRILGQRRRRRRLRRKPRRHRPLPIHPPQNRRRPPRRTRPGPLAHKTPEFHELQIFYTPRRRHPASPCSLTSEVHLSDIPRTPPAPSQRARLPDRIPPTLPGIFMFAYFGGLYYDQPKEILAGSRKGETEPLAEGYIADNPLRNATVRKAMNLAIDRELIIETFWGDGAVPASTYGIPPYRYDFKEEWVPYPYDPEESKRLLAEAGYPNGFEFTVTTAKMGGVPEGPEVAEVLASMWTEVGLNSNIEPVEFGEILKRARERTWGQNVYTIRYGAGNPFPSDPCYPMSSVAGGCGNPTWGIRRTRPALPELQSRRQPGRNPQVGTGHWRLPLRQLPADTAGLPLPRLRLRSGRHRKLHR